jgi:glucose/arabinose dehydrogenase
LVLAAACAVAVPLASGSPQRAQLRFRQIASGFDHPVFVAQPKSEPDRLYVVEKAGRIRVLVNGRRRATPFLDIHNQVSGATEEGLLSMAFNPDYASNHRFYVYYTDRNRNVRVVSYRSNGVRAIASSRRQLLFVSHPFSNHNGGQLEIGPDGQLWAGTGDGGSEDDPRDYGQNLNGTRLSKLLRIDLKTGRVGVVAFGLRNPWRFSFDRANGDLYIGDVGQNRYEEIDYRARAAIGSLANYGWSAYEGFARFKPQRLVHRGELVWPVTVYNHSQGCSVTGGYVYRGSAVPAAKGRYFYGDYCSGRIWSLKIVGGKASGVRLEPTRIGGLSSFGEDARGELYAVSLGGRIYRLVG